MTEQVAEIKITIKRGKERPELAIKIDLVDDIDAKELAILLASLEKLKEAIIAELLKIKPKEND